MVQKGMRGNVGAVEYLEEVREDTADSRSPSPPPPAVSNDFDCAVFRRFIDAESRDRKTPLGLPSSTVNDGGISHFHARYLDSWNSVGAEKVGVESISPRAFPKTYRSVWAPSWLSSKLMLNTGVPYTEYFARDWHLVPGTGIRYCCSCMLRARTHKHAGPTYISLPVYFEV